MRRVKLLASLIALTATYPTFAQAEECYNVGTWNIEHYGFGTKRGFPEYTRGGPTYPAHTDSQRNKIAEVIRDELNAKILVLNEINGVSGTRRSAELDDLTSRLGATWQYAIGIRGGRYNSQRVAILWNSSFVRRIEVHEIFIKRKMVQGDDIFDRDPLAARFVFLRNGQPMNDLVVRRTTSGIWAGQHAQS